MVCPSQQNYGSLDTLFSGGTFPPNLAITACGAQRWLLIDRTHCDLDRNDDSSPTKKSTSYGSHSLNWGQGVKRMVLHLWHQTCVCTAFSSLRAVKMGLLVTHGHQLCLSTRHAVCTLPGGFPPWPRVMRSAFYLVGFLPVLPWAEDGKWEGAGAGRLWSRLLAHTPLPPLSVLCEAGKLCVCGSPALVFSPLQVGGSYISHLPAWKAIRADLQRTVFLINWRIHRAYSYSQEQGCHQKRI